MSKILVVDDAKELAKTRKGKRGRPPGSKNKQRVLIPPPVFTKQEANALLASGPNPLECMLEVMRYYHRQFLEYRNEGNVKKTDEAAKSLMFCAKETAPYCHAKVTTDDKTDKTQTLVLNF